MITASCPAPFCSFQCVRKVSPLRNDVLHVPRAVDLSEMLVTEKLSVSAEIKPNPWVCGRHKNHHCIPCPVAYCRGCGLNHGQLKESENRVWRELPFFFSLGVEDVH